MTVHKKHPPQTLNEIFRNIDVRDIDDYINNKLAGPYNGLERLFVNGQEVIPGGGVGTGDKSFTFTQTTATDEWLITHNLDKHPSVAVVDSAGSAVVGSVTYLTNNQLKINFNAGFKGHAFLN